jgi:predicted nucleotidyltransferase
MKEPRVADPDLARLVAEASDAFAPSQAELAAEIGVRPLALTTWRSGRSRPTTGHLRGLAQALANRGERLQQLAARLEARASTQGKLTRRRRGRLNPDHATAQDLASQIAAAANGRVCRVVFYGSRARGTPRSPASDWDFIAVFRDAVPDAEAEEQRLKHAVRSPGETRLDIWPISYAEWQTSRRLHGHPVRTAEREGVVLYDAG